MKPSPVLVRLSGAALVGAGLLALSASSRAEIIERVVAKVNGDIITQSEFEARQLAAVQSARIPSEQVEAYLRQNNARILQEAVDDLLITQRAADLGIKLRPEYVLDVIDGIKKENNIPDDAELKRQLRREGMSLDDLKRNIERSVLRRQVLSRELEQKATVTEAEARAEYEQHKSEYGKSASVHLQEIVVADGAQAQDVVRRARGGEDFSSLARALSTAGSRANGGDLGQVNPGDMNPELAKVVGALAVGGVSDPITLENGFRIVRLVAKEDATVTPYEDLKEEITKRLTQQRMASVYDEYVVGLRKASEKTTQTTVSEVSLTVPNVPTSTLSGPGLGPAPGAPEAAPTPAAPNVPAVPGIDASEISTTPRRVPSASRLRPPSPRLRRRPRRPVRKPDRRAPPPAGPKGTGARARIGSSDGVLRTRVRGGARHPPRPRRHLRAGRTARGRAARSPRRRVGAARPGSANGAGRPLAPRRRGGRTHLAAGGRGPGAAAPSPAGGRGRLPLRARGPAPAWSPLVSHPGPRGTLEEFPLPAVLRPLLLGKKTGPLRNTRGKVTKTLYLSEGRLIFATSTDPDDRLGEMLLRKGLISYRSLEESVRAIKEGKRQGTLLVESGAIRSKDLVDGVTEQVQEIIYSVFQWDDGNFDFHEGDLPSREVIVLRMSTADLIMEGVRRVERWTRIRRAVGGLGQQYRLAADTASTMGDMSLHKEEMDLIATVDGVMSLEEICAAARQSDFKVCRTVWGLWAAGVLDRVPQDAAPERSDKTEPHAERMRGAAVGREIEGFNELHRFLFELVSYELREKAPDFFERAFSRALDEEPALFEGVSVDAAGELDSFALRRNIVSGEIARYLAGLDRLLAIEAALVRELLGERKAGIINDGLMALKERQLQRAEKPS